MKNDDMLYDSLVSLSPIQFTGILFTLASTASGYFQAMAVALVFTGINIHLEGKRRKMSDDLRKLMNKSG